MMGVSVRAIPVPLESALACPTSSSPLAHHRMICWTIFMPTGLELQPM